MSEPELVLFIVVVPLLNRRQTARNAASLRLLTCRPSCRTVGVPVQA